MVKLQRIRTVYILKEQERFYRELYKSSINSPNTGEKISSFLNDLNIPQLSEEEKNSCER